MLRPDIKERWASPLPTLYLNNEDQEAMLAWAGMRAHLDGPWPEHAKALGVYEAETGKLRAVLVTVETYSGIIDCHFASDGSKTWATRNILRGLFGYVFKVRKAHRIQTVSPASNRAILRVDLALGWQCEGTARDAMGPGQDGVIFGMTPETCIWLKDDDHGIR